MISQIRKLTFSPFLITLEALEDIHLFNFNGSTFRGAFGVTLKNIVCIHPRWNKSCNNCLIKNSCAYSYIFENSNSAFSTEKTINYQNAPHPFILEPPYFIEENYFPKGEYIQLGFILVGKGIQYLPYFIHLFDALGKNGLGRNRGEFKLQKVEVRTPVGLSTIYDRNSKNLIQDFKHLTISDINPQKITNDLLEIGFLTPLRVKLKGKLLDSISFKIIIINVIRRVRALIEYHCNSNFNIDENNIIKKAQEIEKISESTQWIEFDRFSSRQKTHMKLGGIVGTMKFKGNFEPFIELLKLGEFIHIGKSTSFGFGKYKLNN